MDSPSRSPDRPIGSELVQEDETFADIVLQFVDGLSRRLNTMEDAIRAEDFEALRAAAHQLKGSGGGYGYPILSEQAAKLEQNARAQVLDDCTSVFGDLKKLCSRVVVNTGEETGSPTTASTDDEG